MTNWEQIRSEYIGGGISQRALAKKAGVPYRTLSERARNEGWTDERKRIAAEAREKVSEVVASRKVETMTAIVSSFESMAQSVQESVAEISKLSPLEQIAVQKDLILNIRELTRIAGDLYQRPTVNEQIQRERLELMVRQYDDEKKQIAAGAAAQEWVIHIDGATAEDAEAYMG